MNDESVGVARGKVGWWLWGYKYGFDFLADSWRKHRGRFWDLERRWHGEQIRLVPHLRALLILGPEFEKFNGYLRKPV